MSGIFLSAAVIAYLFQAGSANLLWWLAVTFGVLLSLSGVLPLLFSKADLSDVGGEVSAYDADYFAGDQGGQDGALPDADAGIPEGDQVEAEDGEEDAD